ncbi:MAG: hypothetical protein MUE85_07995 [Microscillaceae bacterium]|nr:hypothetical protein [Microscillaceae bacterium]
MDIILGLQNYGFDIHCLRGNHEETLLESYWQYLEAPDKEYQQLKNEIELREWDDLFEDDFSLKYNHFLTNLPYYFELEDFYLVHAGFNLNSENPFADKYAMVSSRKMNFQGDLWQGKRIVFGHTITSLDAIQNAIAQKSALIPLDNGCYIGLSKTNENQREQYAHLCALNLNTWELFKQSCIDG